MIKQIINNVRTNEEIGADLRTMANYIAMAIAFTYAAGYALGKFIHNLNDVLVDITVHGNAEVFDIGIKWTQIDNIRFPNTTVKQLREIASSVGIATTSRMKKAELVTLIGG